MPVARLLSEGGSRGDDAAVELEAGPRSSPGRRGDRPWLLAAHAAALLQEYHLQHRAIEIGERIAAGLAVEPAGGEGRGVQDDGRRTVPQGRLRI